MPKLSTLPALLAAVAAASGCASLGAAGSSHDVRAMSWKDVRSSDGAVIVAETPAPAPAGLASFCERNADMCLEGAAGIARDASWFRPVVWSGEAAPAVAWTQAPREDGAAIFARMLQMRAQGLQLDYPRSRAVLDERLWRELAEVNRQVNRSIAAATDEARYGAAEYWAMPLSRSQRAGEPVQGDCEDYALEKRARLIELGWNPASLALAVADAPGVGIHAVLIAQTDRGDFVLDNLFDAPLPPHRLEYGWVSRQVGASMVVWASARVEAAPAIEPAGQVLMTSADRPLALGASLGRSNVKAAG